MSKQDLFQGKAYMQDFSLCSKGITYVNNDQFYFILIQGIGNTFQHVVLLLCACLNDKDQISNKATCRSVQEATDSQ